jgi:hypothetical protein
MTVIYDREEADEIVEEIPLSAEQLAYVASRLDTITALAAYLDPEAPASSLNNIASIQASIDEIYEKTKNIGSRSLSVSLRDYLRKKLRALEEQFQALVAAESKPQPQESKIQPIWVSQAESLSQITREIATGAIGRDTIPAICFISYAWPTTQHDEKEKWVQPFLKVLRNQMQDAGVRTTIDTEDCGPGENMVVFMTENCQSSTFAFLMCTESLVSKHTALKYSNVQSELALLAQRLDYDMRLHKKTGIYPVLLSGTIETSVPTMFRRLHVIDSQTGDYPMLFKNILNIVMRRVMNTIKP